MASLHSSRSSFRSCPPLLLAAAMVIGHGPAAAEEPRVLTLGEAVPYALEHNPDLVIEGKSIDAAKARVSAAKTLRLPRVSVDATLSRWDRELSFDLAEPGMDPPPDGDTSITVRDQITSSVRVTAEQPITDLFGVGRHIKGQRAALAAARANLDAAQLDVATETTIAYFRSLQSRTLRDAAATDVTQLEAHLDYTEKRAGAGKLQSIDVMRLRSALAAARQRSVAAQAEVRTTDEALLLLLGMPLDSEIAPRDPFAQTLAAPTWTTAQAVELALRDRPELAGATARTEQASTNAKIAKLDLAPRISAVATYEHSEGGGSLQSSDSWFVGLTLRWDAWDWGKKWHDAKAAKATASQARLSERRQYEQIEAEVRRLVREATSAHDQLDVAREGVEASDEAVRIQTVRYREGAATTAELLDAQDDSTEARVSLATARYGYLIALARLYRGLGAMPANVADLDR